MNKFIIIISILFFISCSEEKKPVMIDTNYINIDGSINNRAVFSKAIKKENWLKNRYKKAENIWR